MTLKIFRNAIAAMMFAVTCGVALTACSSDDDDNPADEPSKGATELLFAGVTRTWPTDNPESVYTAQRASTYDFVIDYEAGTASIVITDADFLNGMPALDPMTFPGISFRVNSADNTILLSCDALTPEIGGRPFSAFPISDLTATVVPGKSANLIFTCGYRDTPYIVSFTGTPLQ